MFIHTCMSRQDIPDQPQKGTAIGMILNLKGVFHRPILSHNLETTQLP